MTINEERFFIITVFSMIWLGVHLYVPYFLVRIPDSIFYKYERFFTLMPIEKNGAIYENIFKIKKWKKYLPDGGKYMKGGFSKKQLESNQLKYIKKFLIESYRAELSHWMIIVHASIFLCWTDKTVFLIMLAYALTENIPCIIVQRYNRPRLQRLIKKNERIDRMERASTKIERIGNESL
ncbi:MAG: hypothetical protein ACRCST_13970 [Turicibacter sp.]